jgi:deoxyribodipyrimidine photolyase
MLTYDVEVLSRFLNTKSRASQLGTADPLADGAEQSDKRSRILVYGEQRDRGDRDTTSRLSPYLSAGVISARQCVRATMSLTGLRKVDAGKTTGIGRWVQELGRNGFTILETGIHSCDFQHGGTFTLMYWRTSLEYQWVDHSRRSWRMLNGKSMKST